MQNVDYGDDCGCGANGKCQAECEWRERRSPQPTTKDISIVS